MGKFYKICMVLLINIYQMPTDNIQQKEALRSFMSRTAEDEKLSLVVQAGDEPAVVGPPKFKIHKSENSTFFNGPAFPQPTYEMGSPTSPKLTTAKRGRDDDPLPNVVEKRFGDGSYHASI
jgi:hypothetical protein